MELNTLIAECTAYDFKVMLEEKKPKSWLKSASAFANGLGGSLFFGIDNDGIVKGLDDVQHVCEAISSRIRDYMDPLPEVELIPHDIDGLHILQLKVNSGHYTPYYYVGDGQRIAFVRVGDESMPATAEQMVRLVLKGSNKTFDSLHTDYKAEDYSFTILANTFKDRTKQVWDKKYLLSFGLVTGAGNLTNAGALFADDCPLWQSRLYCTRWDGKEKGDAINDAEFTGNILMLLREAMNFVKSNTKRGWEKLPNGRKNKPEYAERAVLEAMVNHFIHRDYTVMGSEVHLGENKGASLHNDNYFNVPTKDTEVDVNFPDYGYLSTGYKFTEKTGISFQLGMGEQSVGRTQTGSIILSDYMTGASFGKLSLYSPDFKYTFDTIQLNVDKYMYFHLFEGRIAKKLTVSFMEATLTNASWELRYLNPLMIYHGMAPWRDYSDDDANNGEFMGIKLDWAPFRYTRFFGMFAMNQYQVPYERRDYADSLTPNSLGGQAGFEAMIPAAGGYVKIAGEGYYAQPTLYIKQSPDWSFFRTYTDNIGDNAIFYEWTGSPFGPDTIAGEISIGYEKPGVWSLDLIYLFLAQGENAEKSIFYDKKSDTWYSSTDNDNAKIGGSTDFPLLLKSRQRRCEHSASR